MSSAADTSVLLWVASACIAFLGARTFFEYLRRLHYDGPWVLWRELLLGALALAAAYWSAMVIDIGAQGLAFQIGYHPAKVFGTLFLGLAALAGILVLATMRHAWLFKLVAAPLAALIALAVQVGVIWSIGAEPRLAWSAEPLVFALLVNLIGIAFASFLVVSTRRGSRRDRPSRRLLAALMLGACIVASQELVLSSAGLAEQVASKHARFLPELVITLVAGAGFPVAFVLLLVDQRTQQRSRASERRRRRRKPGAMPSQTSPAPTTMGDAALASTEGEAPPAH